jgi:hypothetical protein
MAHQRPTQRELAAAKKATRQQDMDRAIAEGRLVVRKMTAEERAERHPLDRRGQRPRRTSTAAHLPLTTYTSRFETSRMALSRSGSRVRPTGSPAPLVSAACASAVRGAFGCPARPFGPLLRPA